MGLLDQRKRLLDPDATLLMRKDDLTRSNDLLKNASPIQLLAAQQLAGQDSQTPRYEPVRMGVNDPFSASVRKAMDRPIDADNYLVQQGIMDPSNFTNGDLLNLLFGLIPGLGDAMAIDDGNRELEKGNKGLALLNYASTFPAVGDAAKLIGAGGVGLLSTLPLMARNTAKAPITPFSKQSGIIGGVNAKTANVDLLKKAQDMENAGEARDAIWNQTGWFKGVDGKWRFEIDDSQSVFKLGHKGNPIGDFFDEAYQGRGRLPFHEVMDHPGISSAYTSELNSMGAGEKLPGFIAIPDSPTYNGRYLPGDDLIELNRSLPKTAARSTGLHELQHAIQEREGFAKGGSTEQMALQKMRALKEYNAFNDARILKAEMQSGKSVDDALRMYKELGIDMDEDALLLAESHDFDALKQISDQKFKELQQFGDWGQRDAAYNAYRRLAGEAEARAVQARRNLTPAERAARPFWLDYDVPEADQIVRFK